MKKVVSAILVLVLMLAIGAAAYADIGILVTKHPTDETRTEGETAWFVSGARYYDTLDWTFVDPSGHEYPVKEFVGMFPYVTVEGEHSTTLKVRNLTTALNGWAVYCSFHSANDNASTNWAFFRVNAYVPTYPVYPTLYADEFGPYTPAHPSVDPCPQYVDEFGPYTPAHPSVDPYPQYVDEFGPYTPAHPSVDPYPQYVDEFGPYTPAHPN